MKIHPTFQAVQIFGGSVWRELVFNKYSYMSAYASMLGGITKGLKLSL